MLRGDRCYVFASSAAWNSKAETASELRSDIRGEWPPLEFLFRKSGCESRAEEIMWSYMLRWNELKALANLGYYLEGVFVFFFLGKGASGTFIWVLISGTQSPIKVTLVLGRVRNGDCLSDSCS